MYNCWAYVPHVLAIFFSSYPSAGRECQFIFGAKHIYLKVEPERSFIDAIWPNFTFVEFCALILNYCLYLSLSVLSIASKFRHTLQFR